MLDSYDYFSSGVSFSIISQSFGSLTQRVTPVYDRYYFAGFKKLCQEGQIVLAWHPQARTQFLAAQQ